MAIKEFFKEIYAVDEATNKAIQAMVCGKPGLLPGVWRVRHCLGNPEVPALTRRCLSIPNHF